MDDEVNAKFNGFQEIGRGKGVINGRQQVMFFSYVHGHLKVNDIQQRVRGRLQPQQPGVRSNGGFNIAAAVHAHESKFNSETSHHVLEEPVGTAVDIVTGDDVVTGAEQMNNGRFRGHTGGESEGRLTSFEAGDGIFQYLPGGVTGT